MSKSGRKRVLIVTYYWPPGGGITVLRCLKFAKYLRRTGWEPVIFTAANAHYPVLDHSNERDVPENLEVLYPPIWEPYGLYKKFTGKPADENVNNVFYTEGEAGGWKHRLAVWVRSNFFIPDARATWIRGSVRHLLSYLGEKPVDALLSSGPPHTNTRIATLIKKATGLPWLADYQDPWTQVDYYQLLSLTKRSRRKHERMEQEAFALADKTVIVSPSWKRDLEQIGARNVGVITGGYDPDDFEPLDREPHHKFTLLHPGILGFDRNPDGLLRALAELKERQATFGTDLELRLFGQVHPAVLERIEHYGLTEQTRIGGFIPRGEALREMVNSHVLLLLLNQQDNAQGRIPGKLFEYLAARRPIVALGPTDSDVAGILETTETGVIYDYSEGPAALTEQLARLYANYRAGTDVPVGNSNVEAYSLPHLTKQLGKFLDEIVVTAPATTKSA